MRVANERLALDRDDWREACLRAQVERVDALAELALVRAELAALNALVERLG